MKTYLLCIAIIWIVTGNNIIKDDETKDNIYNVFWEYFEQFSWSLKIYIITQTVLSMVNYFSLFRLTKILLLRFI